MAGLRATPIVALDVPDVERALEIARRLDDTCGFYKIGSELFTAAGRKAIDAILGEGKRVFLDLKFHDIPSTVRSACREAAGMGASLLTVHATGGPAMLAAAVDGAGSGCGVLAVTILTSMDAAELSRSLGRSPMVVEDEVSRLAALARESGVHGVVCSGHEAPRVRRESGPDLALLVPGIRLAGGASHDQKRVMSPSQAAEAGATYLVIGRAVTAAPEPAEAMRSVLADLAVT